MLDREHFVAPIEQKPLPNLTELESAYRWAYQHGITTLAPFEDARLDEAITRAELSKMLSVYAIKFMQRAVNFDKLSCKEYRDL